MITLTHLERDCLVRALAQDGRFYPTGFDSATTEVVKAQLLRKGFLSADRDVGPRITTEGIEAVNATRGKELADH